MNFILSIVIETLSQILFYLHLYILVLLISS
jgi:hypothetical protein